MFARPIIPCIGSASCFATILRDHPAKAKAYADLKRRLAAEADGDWDFYTGGKTEFVEETIRLATLKT
ncbi:GrpB-like predicted nucleotidyltransferase (UPF0157 family) [Rhizobium sp. BK049]|nr:GrpB-like predicted nucleotidyltransferase (UPF0157 family) [Rhizobium sp. BK049]